MASLRIGVRHSRSPSEGVGASCTGSVCQRALARATATARRAALATPSTDRSELAAKPQVPFAITRTPTPSDSVLLMSSTLSSRVRSVCRR